MSRFFSANHSVSLMTPTLSENHLNHRRLQALEHAAFSRTSFLRQHPRGCCRREGAEKGITRKSLRCSGLRQDLPWQRIARF